MRGWHGRIDADLASLLVIKRGFGGSNMYDVRYFLSELVLRHKPRAVLLYEGDNDVALGASPEQVMEHFDAIVEGVYTHIPEARIYVLAVKPSIARWRIWPAMAYTNDMIKARSDTDARLALVDVATLMLGADGKPPANLLISDKLHMTEAGYDVWREATRKVVVTAERDMQAQVSK